jgi:uncharacterized repeat protein (TIGR01451 family)
LQIEAVYQSHFSTRLMVTLMSYLPRRRKTSERTKPLEEKFPMKTQPTSRPDYHRANLSSVTRIAAFVALVALIGIPLFSSSLASSTSENSRALSIPRSVNKSAAINLNIFGSFLNARKQPAQLPFSPALVETIETLAADCETPKTEFFLGETVCAKVSGVTETDRFVNWVAPPASTVVFSSPTITQDPEYFTYTPQVVGGWKATIADPSDSSIIPTYFNVNAVQPLATYAADCLTPKSTFNLGETVCARAVGFGGSNNRLAWIDPANLVRTFTSIISDPQIDPFMLPSTDTSVVDIFVVDNRGTWKVNVLSGDGRQLESVPFTVQKSANPNDAAADLSLSKSLNGEAPDAAQQFSFTVAITNFGPNTAENVSISDPNPANATFVSATQTSGATFTCTGSNPVICEPANAQKTLAVGATATFELTYTAGAANSTIINVASVSSDTTEINQSDNTATARVTVGGTGGTPPTCTLDCPADMSVPTNTAGGANVTFPGADQFGDCGTVNYNHASGSFFPIGTTVVTATSSTGGGTCSFTVTVIDAPNPTISCPPDQTVAAASGQTEANVNVGSPSVTPTGATVKGLRSDSQHIDDPPSDFPGLTDPYPIGTTLITWTATDQYGRSASCVQKIKVTSQDAPTISCPSDKTFTAPSGSCTYTATAGEIGTPTTGGAASSSGEPCPVNNPCAVRSDHLALTDPFPAGVTYIVWTATNDFGSTSCTQSITVNAVDNQPPTLHVPPDVNATTSTCTATLDDELGVATAEDNCTASVDITRSGVPTFSCPTPENPNKQCESFVFPTGTTTITYTAKDAAGNTTTGLQYVTVTEDPAIPPTVDAPPNVTLYTGANATACSVTVSNLDTSLGTATASDNCPGVSVARSGVPAGNIFPLGNTTVTYTATDKSGNTATDTQVVTVVDNTPPVVTPPLGPVTLYTGPNASSCGVTVNNLDGTFGTGSATDNCSGVGAVSRSGVPSGNFFPVGNTTLTYSATDAHGNTGSATQLVTVVDNTPPVISCPANITLEPTCPSGAIATYTTPTATDNCGVQSVVRNAGSLASGSVFPIGTSTVTYTATDIHGNTSSCSFTVTVKTAAAVVQDLITRTQAIQPPLTGQQSQGLVSKLNQALTYINNGNYTPACGKLSDYVTQVQNYINNGTLTSAQGQPLINSANKVRNTIGCTNLPCS